jgi:hypothetical protein
MSLFVDTPEGAAYEARQHPIVAAMKQHFGCTEAIETRDRSGALMEAMLGFHGEAHSVIEVKTRNMTYRQLRERYSDALFSERKVQAGIAQSSAWKVPFVMVLGFRGDRTVCWWKVTNADGSLAMNYEIAREEVLQPVGKYYETQYSAHFRFSDMHVIAPSPT